MHDHHDHDAPQAQAFPVPTCVPGTLPVPESRNGNPVRRYAALVFAAFLFAVLVYVFPPAAAVLAVSAGLYLVNRHIDAAAAKWGSK